MDPYLLARSISFGVAFISPIKRDNLPYSFGGSNADAMYLAFFDPTGPISGCWIAKEWAS